MHGPRSDIKSSGKEFVFSSKFVVSIEFPLLCYIAVSGLTLLQLIAKAIIKYKEFTPG